MYEYEKSGEIIRTYSIMLIRASTKSRLTFDFFVRGELTETVVNDILRMYPGFERVLVTLKG